MNSRTISTVAVLTSTAILTTSCSNMSAGQNAAVFGGLAALGTGAIVVAAGGDTEEAVGAGIVVGTVVAIIVYNTRKATERQKTIAEERAKKVIAAIPPARKAEMKKKKIRIAIETEREVKTSPKPVKTIALVDVESESVVDNQVFDIQETPKVGEYRKFETQVAQYVGTGS